jgi:hypothetical protein
MNFLTPVLSAFILVFGFSCASPKCSDSGAQCPATQATCPAQAKDCSDCKGACDGKCETTEAMAMSVTLCGGCGQVKGAPNCCLDGATKCSGCGLDKGAPGCCKMEKGKDAKLCGCGEIGGSEACKAKCASKAKACCAAPGSDACKTDCGN